MVQHVRRFVDECCRPASPLSRPASTASAASSVSLAPILSMPPWNRAVVYERREIDLALLDHGHQTPEDIVAEVHPQHALCFAIDPDLNWLSPGPALEPATP